MMIANQRVASATMAHDVVGEPVVDSNGRYVGAIAGVLYDPRHGFTALTIEGGGGRSHLVVVDEGIRYGPCGWQLTQAPPGSAEVEAPPPRALAEPEPGDYLVGQIAAESLRGPRGEGLIAEGERVTAAHIRQLARAGRLEALRVR